MIKYPTAGPLPVLAAVVVIMLVSSCRRPPPGEAPLPAPEPSVVFAGIDGELVHARIETDRGTIRCQVNRRRTPRASALFVGLATGRGRWRDPATGRVEDRPLYAGLSFFRAIEDVMIQSGCPLNNGTGDPGYRIEVEADEGDAERLSHPGALVLARYTQPPNRTDPHAPPAQHVLGSQFAVLLTDMHHLAGQVSVVGQCEDLDVASAIARTFARDKQPTKLLRIGIDSVASRLP